MAYETSLRPYFVKMTCGHFEIRLMREATARHPWGPDQTLTSQAKCRACYSAAYSADRLHGRDTQCCLDETQTECIVCGVSFVASPCKSCRGRGFHFPGCDAMCLKTWNGLHCGKEAGHEPDCAFVPRCEGGA